MDNTENFQNRNFIHFIIQTTFKRSEVDVPYDLLMY